MLAASPSHSSWTSQSSWAANKKYTNSNTVHIYIATESIDILLLEFKPTEHIHSRHTTPGNNSQALYWRIANGLFPSVKHTNTRKYINDIHVTQKQ